MRATATSGWLAIPRRHYRSQDGPGATWGQTSSSHPPSGQNQALRVSVDAPTSTAGEPRRQWRHRWLAVTGPGSYRLAGWATWGASAFTYRKITSLRVICRRCAMATSGWLGTSDGIYRSQDGGATCGSLIRTRGQVQTLRALPSMRAMATSGWLATSPRHLPIAEGWRDIGRAQSPPQIRFGRPATQSSTQRSPHRRRYNLKSGGRSWFNCGRGC